MLNAMRFGQLDQAMCAKFSALSRKVEYTDDIEPSELYDFDPIAPNADMILTPACIHIDTPLALKCPGQTIGGCRLYLGLCTPIGRWMSLVKTRMGNAYRWSARGSSLRNWSCLKRLH